MENSETIYISKVTTGATHEFMNVLATIRESSGLMADLLFLSDETVSSQKEKFLKIVNAIQAQVKRGIEISSALNQFGHSLDGAKKNIDVNELLFEFACLMKRSAAQKKVQLQIQSITPSLFVWVDYFNLQMVLANCLESCLAKTSPDSIIRLQPQDKEGQLIIRMVLDKDTSLTEEQTVGPQDENLFLQSILKNIDAQLLPIQLPDLLGLELIISLKGE